MKYIAIPPPLRPSYSLRGGNSPPVGNLCPSSTTEPLCLIVDVLKKTPLHAVKIWLRLYQTCCFDVPLSCFAVQSFRPLIRKFAHIYLFSQHSRSPDKYKISRLEVLVARFITLLYFWYTVDEERSGLLKKLAKEFCRTGTVCMSDCESYHDTQPE